MSRLRLIFLCTAAAAVLLVSCYPDSGSLVLEGQGTLDVAEWSIINGEPPNAAHHDATVALHELTKQGQIYVLPFCSGTLIAEDVVLTAAHCLNTSSGPKVRTMKPSLLAIFVGDDPQADSDSDGTIDLLEHLYATTETLIHPGFDPYSLQDDIALVRLSQPVVEPVTPVAALPASLGLTSADLGATINFAGFGDDENGDYGVKLQIDGTLDGLGCSVPGCPDGGYPDSQISYSQPTSGPCFGDSGGPAFLFRDSTPYVAGITSYGDNTCSVYGVSTRPDAYDTWIQDFVGVAPVCDADAWCNPDCAEGEDPDCDVPPVCDADAWCNPDCPEGEDPDCDVPPDCSADGWCNPECLAGEDPDCSSSSCGDGVCGAGESCDGRYGTVACSDCAGKTNGKPSGRYCYVEGVCEGPGCP